jgi:ribosomal protein S18 acetylase RimI-like enzyme
MGDVTYRQATAADLRGMGEVYVRAFPDSIRHFYADREPNPQALADLFAIVLAAEPAAAQLAEADGAIAGYCLAPLSLAPIRREAVAHGHLLRLGWRWLSGSYGLGLLALRALVSDKLAAWRHQVGEEPGCEARILSIAVDPVCQGQGIGRRLLAEALARLEGLGAPGVRLEVRPDNAAALGLYERLGFATVGRMADSQGEWLIMLRRPRSTPEN